MPDRLLSAKSGTATSFPIVGDWLIMNGINTGAIGIGINAWRGWPVLWPNATWDAVAFEVTTAAAAGSTAKVVIFDDNGGRPGAVLYDGAAVDVSTAGVKTITGLNIVTPGGTTWFGIACYGAAPQVRSIAGTGMHSVSTAPGGNYYSVNVDLWSVPMAGAATANPTASNIGGYGGPRISLRRSA